jgi:hypothetical protein
MDSEATVVPEVDTSYLAATGASGADPLAEKQQGGNRGSV